MTANVEERIKLFVSLLQDLYNHEFSIRYQNLVPSRIDAMAGGSKYRRITCTQQNKDHNTGAITDGQRSVYCFIDMSNGDILKADGWAKPAKGARGNIFNVNCDVGFRADMNGAGLYK